jgi:SAM-dependent methyltransferase
LFRSVDRRHLADRASRTVEQEDEMTHASVETTSLPGSDLDTSRMPAHWLLARLGKRVLRPGGLELTRQLLDNLAIRSYDEVIEFAPGLGTTARLILERAPLQYTGVERDRSAMQWTRRQLPDRPDVRVVAGAADKTDLPDASATVVLGEAMLSMNTLDQKKRIVREAFRLLVQGGRYGIHELCLVPDDMPAAQTREIEQALASVLHVGARPLQLQEWRALLKDAGFRIVETGHAPMHLLRPWRLIQDEGLFGALRLVWNVLRDAKARHRILAMKRIFARYQAHLGAVFIVAEKPYDW